MMLVLRLLRLLPLVLVRSLSSTLDVKTPLSMLSRSRVPSLLEKMRSQARLLTRLMWQRLKVPCSLVCLAKRLVMASLQRCSLCQERGGKEHLMTRKLMGVMKGTNE
uniref:Secreted protein n=1 Tax=Brassica campestris TaxID=3711 RepID=A0A3P5ZGP0_BRACM|nr:unnamed protein product [Brassica rapa]